MWDLGAKCWASASAADHDEHFVGQVSNAPDGREEKAAPIENTFSQSDDSSDLDGSVQDGVREVEAVTSAWDTKSLILVFFLYASNHSMIHISYLKLTPPKHLRNLHGRFHALYHVHRILGICHQ